MLSHLPSVGLKRAEVSPLWPPPKPQHFQGLGAAMEGEGEEGGGVLVEGLFDIDGLQGQFDGSNRRTEVRADRWAGSIDTWTPGIKVTW